MRPSINDRGRTFWDLIAEHPKKTFIIIILLILTILFLAFNKYTIKSSVLSLEPDKPQTGNGDSIKKENVNRFDTSAFIQKRFIPNSKTNNIKEQIVIKEPNKDTVRTQVVNVTSNNQNGGITANQVNIGVIQRNLNINLQKELLSLLPSKNEKININSIMGDSESFQFANQIKDFLKSQGFTKLDGVSQSLFTKPVIGQFFDRDSSGVKILVGSNKQQ